MAEAECYINFFKSEFLYHPGEREASLIDWAKLLKARGKDQPNMD